MDNLLEFGLPALILLAGGGFFFAIPIWATFTTPAWDLSMIRSEFEGIQGRAGPYLTVTEIRRDGIVFGSRYSGPTQRLYLVTLARENGEQIQRRVGISVGLFGPGDIANA